MHSRILDRRTFFAGVCATALTHSVAARSAERFFARADVSLGLQLYTLGAEIQKDLDNVLAAVARIGYKSVELPSYPSFLGRSPAELRAAFDRAGLRCTSAHILAQPFAPGILALNGDLDRLADALATIGARTVVMPILRVPDRFQAAPGEGAGLILRVAREATEDDWKSTADFLNEKGAALARRGLRLGYHNHNFDLAPLGQTTGLEILLQRTDPKLVTFELDVGWVAAAGVDPIAFIKRHAGRFGLMHIKDIKATSKANFALTMEPTEVGSGAIDWRRLLAAAYAAGAREFFVEQEPPFSRPRIEAAKVSFDYLATLGV
jgi:sugar phosphate isomerase/epimerase